MSFNVTKYKVMHLGIHNQGYIYEMEGVQLEAICEEKELGVIS